MAKETGSRLLNLVYAIILLNETVRRGIFGLDMALKEILSCLFNQFNTKILAWYLNSGSWSPMLCVKKALHRGVDKWDYVKTYTFNNFVYF